MDPSALIFVALAVAWAVYLIPKALEHHEESARSRTVERFSKTMRVLARREPVNRREARLVTSADARVSEPATPEDVARRSSSRPLPTPATPNADELRDRRRAAVRAVKRRRRVLGLILLANIGVAVAAYLGYLQWVWCAVPGGLLVAWLIACRLMVRREQVPTRSKSPQRAERSGPQNRIPAELPHKPHDQTDEFTRVVDPAPTGVSTASVGDDEGTGDGDRESWDPVQVPLPTYVSKPAAPREVRTIDLDSTGVWSSGHSAADSELAREAEAVERAKPSADAQRRASGA